MTTPKADTYTVAVRGRWDPTIEDYDCIAVCGHCHCTIDTARKCSERMAKEYPDYKVDICVWKAHDRFLQLRIVMEVE